MREKKREKDIFMPVWPKCAHIAATSKMVFRSVYRIFLIYYIPDNIHWPIFT